MILEKIEPRWLDLEPSKRMPSATKVGLSDASTTAKLVITTERNRMVFVAAANKVGEYWRDGELKVCILFVYRVWLVKWLIFFATLIVYPLCCI